MNKEEMESKLNALTEGSQEELVISKKEFPLFLEVWNSHPQKKSFIGEAQLGGEVVYRFKKK